MTRILGLVLFIGLAIFSYFQLASMEKKQLASDWDLRKALIYSNLKGLSASILSANELMRDENLRPLFRDVNLRDALVFNPKLEIIGGYSLLSRVDGDVLLLPALSGDGDRYRALKKSLNQDLTQEFFGEVDEWGLFESHAVGRELFISAPLLGPKVNNQRLRLATLSLRYDLTGLYADILKSQLRFILSLFGFAGFLLLGIRWVLSSVEENMNLRLSNEGLVARRQLMEIFAHDVRKPFQMIRTLKDALTKDLSPRDLKELIQVFNHELDSGLRSVQSMIDDTLELASGRELKIEPAPLRELLEINLQSVLERHPRFGNQVHWDLEFDGEVEWDRARINRVLWNLFENAFQAMNSRSKLFVASKLDADGFVEFTVRNTGAEISPADLGKIFQAGFTRGRNRGTGLGLAIVRDLVERHGGQVSCRSNASLGVEFTLKLPRRLAANPEVRHAS